MEPTLIHNLRQVLGTAFSIYLTTHGAHWNVEGRDFHQFHGLFKDQYEEIWESIDSLAEQMRALDTYAPQSMAAMLACSQLVEADEAPLILPSTLAYLIAAHETLVDLMTETMALAADENQQGLMNFIGGRIEAHQKHRWMLRASSRPAA